MPLGPPTRSITALECLLCALLFVLGTAATLPLDVSAQENRTDVPADSVSYDGPYRPQYHLHPPRGHMGDPSGLIYHEGTYHHFWWDHATSTDLVHWTHQPRALDGVMSGSVVIDSANTSGFGTTENPPWIAVFSLLNHDTRIQTQGIAYSLDQGTTWTKYDGNPVLGIGSTEFRDPQVFWHESTGQWIMVVALAQKHRVQFYASQNLKSWTHLSDFGPAGATRGVWECPDLFPLPVDGDSSNVKWVLEVDVQPIGGQYFVGEFDGTSFHLDPDFAKGLRPSDDPPPPGHVLADFESEDFGAWTVEGEAFGEAPAGGAVFPQTPVVNFEGTGFANGFHGEDAATGMLTSPPFTIDRPYLSFKLGGGERPGEAGVELLVEGEAVRTATGRNMETLHWRSWDVRDLQGRTARFRAVDRTGGGWGHINVDHVMLSDAPAATEREHAYWIDYGMDHYAGRSWHGNVPNDGHRTWIGWMGNWRYEHLVPTEEWRGVQTIPRELTLVSTPNSGPRLLQQPVRELQQLRDSSFALSDQPIDGTLDLTKQHGVSGASVEIIATFEPATADTFGVRVRTGAEQQTEVGYRVEEQQMYVDRRHSGTDAFSRSFPGVHDGPLQMREGTVRLRILVDRSTLEVFGNSGRTVISDLIFPDLQSDGIEVFASGGTARMKSIEVYDLQSVWK